MIQSDISPEPLLNQFCEQDQNLLAAFWLELMARTEDNLAKCRQMLAYSQVLIAQGQAEHAIDQLQDCLAIARSSGARACEARALSLLDQLILEPLALERLTMGSGAGCADRH